ncbi:uncharacterized protein LOC123923714 [Trifolium pratense]|uniref:uncharacterized protein LOC123890772 n=1 Tax=Trifolium pratense TaxID=57577 RepID=UPI001E69313B|nr:uncharacterized protein LOC123890772 [Trifolium pratense]XP_045832393.1 uncharacterized protein LOC123923714 [Trifolium pratense]
MAVPFSHRIEGQIQGHFTTVHVQNENVGELDPYFVAQFFHELGSVWHLIDGSGNQHDVEFNMSATKPLLTNGWPTIRNHYEWIGNIEITFFYHGNNSFRLIPSTAQILPTFFPTFHSSSTYGNDNRSFKIVMNQTTINSNYLVLPRKVGLFLLQTNYSEVKLCGPLNNVVTCTLTTATEDQITTKLGEGWATFCQLNNIVEGNKLKFTCEQKMQYNNVLIVTLI